MLASKRMVSIILNRSFLAPMYSLKTAFPPCWKVQLEKVSLLNATVGPIKMIHNMVQELTYPL